MSVQATSYVWEHAEVTGSSLLVLLAIADAASREGEESCQSVGTLARMARISESQVYRVLSELKNSGAIEATGTHPRYRTVIYRIPGVTLALVRPSHPREGGVTDATVTLAPVRPDPTTNPTTTSSSSPSETEVRDRAVPERHPSRPMTPDWRPSVDFFRFLCDTYPRVHVNEQVVRFRNFYYANQQTSRSWEARLENWVSTEQQRAEERTLNGTDDMGIPLAQRATSVVPGPAQPGDPNYFNPNET